MRMTRSYNFSTDCDMYICSAKNQNNMNILYEWCKCNMLSINLSKTRHMLMYKEGIRVNDVPFLKLHGVSLENVESYNYR